LPIGAVALFLCAPNHRLSAHNVIAWRDKHFQRCAVTLSTSTLYRHHWHVYSKRPFGGAEQALRYLGRYTHRVAISNHRLVSFVDDQVTFRWRDRAHNNEEKLLPLSLDEFLRRATFLPLCLQLLGAVTPSQTEPEASPAQEPSPLWLCPKCGGRMVVIERLTAAQIQLRSPPSIAGVAA
jgi:hypothetical protein